MAITSKAFNKDFAIEKFKSEKMTIRFNGYSNISDTDSFVWLALFPDLLALRNIPEMGELKALTAGKAERSKRNYTCAQ